MITKNKVHHNHPSDGWRYLGSDDKTDFYVANEGSENDSLTGVFSEEGGDYWSYPIHLSSILLSVQNEPEDSDASICYRLYKDSGGRFTEDASEALKEEMRKEREDLIKELGWSEEEADMFLPKL